MAKLVSRCPSCDLDLNVTQLSCSGCGTNLDGTFEIPALLRLPSEDLAFVTAFVRSSGSLKAMAARDGTSYPTVRNRLDEIIAKIDHLEKHVQQRRHDILDALENGRLTATAAEKELRKVGL